ncbi:MAG: hypothetical protein LBP92_15345 [Deltaproteobacteria bacterium]|jgi:hypothetical protein|nr:hypothetical protein [Deltaproteobacteria bacterium]
MWRILLVALLFYLIVWLIRGLVAPGRGPGVGEGDEELVSDALTGVYFPKTKAVSINRDGRKLYFISVGNRDRWLRENGRRT